MNQHFWIYMCLLGLVTFGIRWSFLSIAGRWNVPKPVESLMKYIPAAVFAALSIPALVYAKPVSYDLHDPAHLVAGSIGLLTAYFSRNVLFTILAGLGSLWMVNAML